MDNTYQAPQGRLGSTLVIFLFVLAVLYTLFLLFQQRGLTRAVSDAETELLSIEQEVSELREDRVEELFRARELREDVQETAIEWSGIVKRFQDLTPVTVFFSSYTVSEDGRITVSGLADSYGAVADTIDSLQKSTDFDAEFVPSVTAGATADGQDVVSFSLNVNAILD